MPVVEMDKVYIVGSATIAMSSFVSGRGRCGKAVAWRTQQHLPEPMTNLPPQTLQQCMPWCG
jgi:hypothetical protein